MLRHGYETRDAVRRGAVRVRRAVPGVGASRPDGREGAPAARCSRPRTVRGGAKRRKAGRVTEAA